MTEEQRELVKETILRFVRAIAHSNPDLTGRECFDEAARTFDMMAQMCRDAEPAAAVLS